VLCVWLIIAAPIFAASQIASIIKRAPTLNPNLSLFPESSLLDCSSRLEAPAGKNGFVKVQDGHFTFKNGSRARFFGINLAKNTVFIEKHQIDRLAVLFAHAGINLVRIHQIDDTQGILDPTPKHLFRPERLDLVDYWIYKLKEHGIYVAMDLNDYRTFRADEGVVDGEKLGRGAKPYAVFHSRLVLLQQEYARALLVEHTNPYTGLSYANDPAIALLELYDENGLFIRRNDWRALREPYLTAFQQHWNAWLLKRYGSTETLKAAWTDGKGNYALLPGESLEQKTVQLPRMVLGPDVQNSFKDPLRAPVRQSDGALFAYDMQADYFIAMTGYLRKIGVKIPICAVGSQEIIPDLMTTAANTDYIGINFYWDHPKFTTGREWTLPAYFSMQNPITDNVDNSFPTTVSLARMHNKPLVVRELGYCFPNLYRGTGMIESAAYGAFLDLDALILFTYDAYDGARTIGYFDIHLDPLRWGLVSDAARLFLSGEVHPAKYTVGIGYSLVDACTWYEYQSPVYQLAYSTRVENYTDTKTIHPFDLLIASGRSAASHWLGKRLLLYSNYNHMDLFYQKFATGVNNSMGGLDDCQGYHFQTVSNGGTYNFTFQGIGYDSGRVIPLQAWPAYSTEDVLSKGYLPIATADTAAYGFLDTKNHVMGFRNMRADTVVRVALDALRDWRSATISHVNADNEHWVSDTGQLIRGTEARCLQVDTPTLQVLAGRLENQPATSALKLTTTTPIGTLLAESLDGTPLKSSTNIRVKMTSRAHNNQVKLDTSDDGPKPYKLSTIGESPIRTDGKAVETPTRVEIGRKLLLELYLQNGTWEYLTEPGRALLYIDTGDITITLPEKPKLVRWYTPDDTIELTPTSNQLTIPAGVRFTEIIWAK